jgi:hypothetical protein
MTAQNLLNKHVLRFAPSTCSRYRTYCSVAGISEAECDDNTPQGVPELDSIDMWGYLNGSQHSSQRKHMILELITYDVTPQFPLIGVGAAILGDYKIVFGHQDPQVRVAADKMRELKTCKLTPE